MNKQLIQQSKSVAGKVVLPASKSIANRLLIMEALCSDASSYIQNLSTANDTVILTHLLSKIANNLQKEVCILDAEDAGSTFRFLTALLSITEGNWILTGNARMQQRPVEPLVNALQQAGADVQYKDQKGYPPLQIQGKPLQGGIINIPANISSQFISAVMMIAPVMKHGAEIILSEKQVSKPYVNLTAELMKNWGIEIETTESSIKILPQCYVPKTTIVESDWSAASYFYALAALAENADIELLGLYQNSLQGDAALVSIFENLGVKTIFTENGVRLKKIPLKTNYFVCNCLGTPDLAQSLAVVCVGLQIPAMLTGLDNLAIKETNRVKALTIELQKLGASVRSTADTIEIQPASIVAPEFIETYHDHRMAMAFAPLIMKLPQLTIQDAEVVVKSFPDFWEQFDKVVLS